MSTFSLSAMPPPTGATPMPLPLPLPLPTAPAAAPFPSLSITLPLPSTSLGHQSSLRNYFASSKANLSSMALEEESALASSQGDKQAQASFYDRGSSSRNLIATATAMPAAAHSSLPFAHTPSSPAPSRSIPASACVSPALAPSSATSSASSSARRRKRERHLDDLSGSGSSMHLGIGGSAVAASAGMNGVVSAPSLLDPCVCKLPARTLLYQLHVLRSDEKMVVRGVEARGSSGIGGSGVEMRLQSAAEAEAEMESREEAEAKQHTVQAATAAAAAAEPASRMWGSSSISAMTYEEVQQQAHAVAAAEGVTEDPEQLTPVSASSPTPSHPLFPDSLDFVSLFLSAAAAHARFRQLRVSWAARGVRNVRARVIEFQLTRAVQVLLVTTEAQRRAWIDVGTRGAATVHGATSMVDDVSSVQTAATLRALPLPLRASPFSKPVVQRNDGLGSAAPGSASTTPAMSPTAASSSSSGLIPASASSASASALPSLYEAPLVPPPLRALLDAREDTLDGFCVSSTLVPESSSASPAAALELSAAQVSGGEVTLRGSVCAQQLHLLDDDKQGRWSQQLLTDLFGKMDVGSKRGAQASGEQARMEDASSSSDAAYPRSLQLAPSSFTAHWMQRPQM